MLTTFNHEMGVIGMEISWVFFFLFSFLSWIWLFLYVKSFVGEVKWRLEFLSFWHWNEMSLNSW